ncbi:MAG: VCBS repeat-containing protein, partial [Candidatus Sabulitectum sp.]|nr:VCBS repeat-containing protein [Candidatus Sabulitectum sp.]
MTFIKYLFAPIILSSFAYAIDNIPWPIGPTDSTHTLFHSYGDYHIDWGSVSSGGINFHFGIDIQDPTPSISDDPAEDVFCVRYGFVSDVCWGPDTSTTNNLHDDYVVVVCDDVGASSGYGWCYQHVEDHTIADSLINPWKVDDEILLGARLGDIENGVYADDYMNHLHLMYSDWQYEPANPGYANPLFYLTTSPTITNGFIWDWNCDPSLYYDPPNTAAFGFFVLPQYEALGTGNTSWMKWNTVADCQIEAASTDLNALSEAVDLFLWFCVDGEGEYGGESVNKSMPQRLEWWIERKQADGTWTEFMADENKYRRYLFDFGNSELGGSNHANKYKQLYFRFSPYEMSTSNGYLCCLTNCGDDTSWVDLGISNIEENSWETKRNLADTGDAISKLDAMFPDGDYRIRWEASVFDGTPDGEVITPSGVTNSNHVDVFVNNFPNCALSALISNTALDEVYWDAGWEVVETTDGYEMEFVVNTDESTYPTNQIVDIEIHFSESVNPNCSPAPTILLEAAGGYHPPITGTFSGTTTPNDTWTGTATLPTVLLPGRLTLLVSCQDLSGEWLEDPANPGTPCMDTYHGVDIAFGIEPGWPESVHDEVKGSPKLADIDLDGDLDVIIQSADGWVDVLDDDGSSMSGWPVSGNWSSGNPDVWASPAVINLTGTSSSAPEILAVHPYGCNGFTATGSAISPWYGIFGSNQRWFALSSPVAGDFNSNGSNEYVIGRQHAQNIWCSITLFARENDGSNHWFTVWGDEYSTTSTASLCDADGDNDLDVVAIKDYTQFGSDINCVLFCLDAANSDEIWNTVIGSGEFLGAISTGNLDPDNASEIVVTGNAGSISSVQVIDGSSGTNQYTNPVSGLINAGASIADIDGDGDNDIVVSSSGNGGMLYCWDGPTGNSLTGFPVNLGTWTDDGVSIGDIDSDGFLELVIAGKDGKLHVINHDGSSTGGFPVTVSSTNALSGQPALGDIDGDGRLEILFGEVNNSVIHCYEMADNSAYTYLPWPQFQHDAANTGHFPTDNTAPGAPSNLTETHTWHGDVVIANLSWILSPDDPGDVIGYRIYGHTPPNSPHLMTLVPASSTSGTVKLRVAEIYNVARFYITAIDGVN